MDHQASHDATQLIRVQRANYFLATTIAIILFLVLLIPINAITIYLLENTLGTDFLPRNQSDEAMVLFAIIAFTTIFAYLLARSGYYLIRYKLKRVPVTHCTACHYDLSGNVSGVCPECGQPSAGLTDCRSVASVRRYRFIGAVAAVAFLVAAVYVYAPIASLMWLFGTPAAPALAAAPFGPSPALAVINASTGTVAFVDRDLSEDGLIHGLVLLGKNDSRAEGGADARLNHCVVYLQNPPTRGPNPAAPAQIFDLAASPSGYSSPVVCVQTGQRLSVRNRGVGARNFLAAARKNAAPNFALPSTGMVKTVVFNVAEADILIYDAIWPALPPCRLHVFDHPYFAVTDKLGRFTLPAIAPGEYELVCEHETLGRVTGTIEITDALAIPVIRVIYDDSK